MPPRTPAPITEGTTDGALLAARAPADLIYEPCRAASRSQLTSRAPPPLFLAGSSPGTVPRPPPARPRMGSAGKVVAAPCATCKTPPALGRLRRARVRGPPRFAAPSEGRARARSKPRGTRGSSRSLVAPLSPPPFPLSVLRPHQTHPPKGPPPPHNPKKKGGGRLQSKRALPVTPRERATPSSQGRTPSCRAARC